MKCGHSLSLGLRRLTIALAIMSGGWLNAAHGQATAVRLLIQQTPIQGGTITPSAGIHHFAPNSQVKLTAVPGAGYRFLYWLGDVSAPAASRTTVYLNGPKVVIAVFELVEHESLVKPVYGGGAGGGMVAAPTDLGPQGSMWLGGGGTTVPDRQNNTRPSFPATAIPEPATLLLLSLGVAALRKSRRRRCY